MGFANDHSKHIYFIVFRWRNSDLVQIVPGIMRNIRTGSKVSQIITELVGKNTEVKHEIGIIGRHFRFSMRNSVIK